MILPDILQTIRWTNEIIGILGPCDTKINQIDICGSVTSWSSDSDLYRKDVLMEECWTEDIDSV